MVPDDDARNDEIVRCSAVELFLERVRTAAPDCPVDEAGMRLIADICRRLDGLPLAIELAAARVATLGGRRVAAGRPAEPADRRAALGAAASSDAAGDVRLSYVLLDPAARALFRRMGCFIGPFAFDAAHAVAAEPASAADMIAVLGELVAKSLVTVEFHGASARYRLTESTRAYALENCTTRASSSASRRVTHDTSASTGTRRRARTPRGATMGAPKHRTTHQRMRSPEHRTT